MSSPEQLADADPNPDPHPRPRRRLAASGDPYDPMAMSGLPYHFQSYGERAGLLDAPVTCAAKSWQVRSGQVLWNAWRAATLRGTGGHQYTLQRRDLYWRSWPEPDDVVINIFQLFPGRMPPEAGRRWFFIDQTLSQLFDGYGQRARLSRGVADRTLAQEREGYQIAELVICNSSWARRSLVEDYGLAEDRTAVVLQAANLLPDAYEPWAKRHRPANPSTDGRPLRLVFVGNDWKRKGLDRLVHAVAAVNTGRCRVVLDVLGLSRSQVPSTLRDVLHVTWHGFVHKMREQGRFLDLLGSADVGCLLSRAEAGGNSLREYHAVGLAVLGTTAGGAAEQTIPEATWLVDPAESNDSVADRLRWLLQNPEAVHAAKTSAWQQRHSVLWPATLNHIDALLRSRGA